DHTWEPESHLENVSDVMQDFHKANPSAPHKLHMAQTLTPLMGVVLRIVNSHFLYMYFILLDIITSSNLSH
ncbi:hypothetical protein BS17DRAFT_698323, partial [Gyrodon lividus]